VRVEPVAERLKTVRDRRRWRVIGYAGSVEGKALASAEQTGRPLALGRGSGPGRVWRSPATPPKLGHRTGRMRSPVEPLAPSDQAVGVDEGEDFAGALGDAAVAGI